MELLLQSISPSQISHFSLRRSFRPKFCNKGAAFAPAARRSTVAVAVARPEKEELVPKVDKNGNFESPELERLTAAELEKIAVAVMEGKDEGRTPSDYDRRARIFCESSRVFRDVNKVSSLKLP